MSERQETHQPEEARHGISLKKKILYGLGGFFALLIAVLLIVPLFLDWNEYKPLIAEKAQEATGRELVIEGDIGLRILPSLALTADGIRLANAPEGTVPHMVSVEELRVRVALLPLLSGRVEVSSVILEAPVIYLETFADGRGNWQLTPATAPLAEERPAPAGEEEAAALPAIGVEKVEISGGRLVYHPAGGTPQTIDDIDLTLKAPSLAGPFAAKGRMKVNGLAVALEARTGVLNGSEASEVRLGLRLGDGKGRLDFEGSLKQLAEGPRIDGTLTAEAPDVADLTAALLPARPLTLPGAMGQSLSLRVLVAGDPSQFSLRDLSLALGDWGLKGRVDGELQPAMRIDTVLKAENWSLDALTALPARHYPGRQARSEGNFAAPAHAFESRAGAGAGFSLPADLSLSLDLGIENFTYQGEALREGRVNLALAEGVLTLNEAFLTLPADGEVALFGVLASEEGLPRFQGTLDAKTASLRRLLDWIKVDVAAIPGDRLGPLSVRAAIDGGPERVTVNGIRAKLDESEVSGGVAVALGERLGLGVNLVLDQINLDAYRGTPDGVKAASGPGPTAGPSPAPAPAPTAGAESAALAALAVLETFDANVRARIDRLVVNGTRVEGIALEGSLARGVLTVKEARIRNFAGNSLALSGTARDFADTLKAEIAFEAALSDVPALMRAASGGAAAPDLVTRLGPVTAKGSVSGGPDSLKLKTTARAVDGTLALAGTIAGLPGAPRVDMTVTTAHPELAGLIRFAAPDYRPAAGRLGPLDVTLRVAGDATALDIPEIKGSIGATTFSGKAGVRNDGPRPRLTASLAAGQLAVSDFLPAPAGDTGAGNTGAAPKTAPQSETPVAQKTGPGPWSREPLDFSALKTLDAAISLRAENLTYGAFRFAAAVLELTLEEGVLTVSRLGADTFGGKLNASALLNSNSGAASLTLGLTNAAVREALLSAKTLDIAGGNLDLSTELRTQGKSTFDLVKGLTGGGRLAVTNGVIKGFDLEALSTRLGNLSRPEDFLALTRTALAGGATPFSDLRANFTMENGRLRSDDIILKAKEGSATASGVVDLAGWAMDLGASFQLARHPEAPPFGMRLVGSLDDPERRFDMQQFQSYLLKTGASKLLDKVLPPKSETGGDSGGKLDGGTILRDLLGR